MNLDNAVDYDRRNTKVASFSPHPSPLPRERGFAPFALWEKGRG
jgi:uracil DNA glycosylase